MIKYFPYLAGKLNELLLVRDRFLPEWCETIAPIIEPVVKSDLLLQGAINAHVERAGSAYIIVNLHRQNQKLSVVGGSDDTEDESSEAADNRKSGGKLVSADDYMRLEQTIQKLTVHDRIYPTIHLNQQTHRDEIERFLDEYGEKYAVSLEGYSDFESLRDIIGSNGTIPDRVFLYETSAQLRTERRRVIQLTESLVLAAPGFEIRRNIDYPDLEVYSELPAVYRGEGWSGFGDFTVTGPPKYTSGGAAWAVAIHVTAENQDDDGILMMHHFKSDDSDSARNIAAKFHQAMTKLIAQLQGNDRSAFIHRTNAMKDLITIHDNEHFPGLGFVKRLSMQHHIETVYQILSK